MVTVIMLVILNDDTMYSN